jgi:hypothetical protein
MMSPHVMFNFSGRSYEPDQETRLPTQRRCPMIDLSLTPPLGWTQRARHTSYLQQILQEGRGSRHLSSERRGHSIVDARSIHRRRWRILFEAMFMRSIEHSEFIRQAEVRSVLVALWLRAERRSLSSTSACLTRRRFFCLTGTIQPHELIDLCASAVHYRSGSVSPVVHRVRFASRSVLSPASVRQPSRHRRP